jgi:hypothetical protein
VPSRKRSAWLGKGQRDRAEQGEHPAPVLGVRGVSRCAMSPASAMNTLCRRARRRHVFELFTAPVAEGDAAEAGHGEPAAGHVHGRPVGSGLGPSREVVELRPAVGGQAVQVRVGSAPTSRRERLDPMGGGERFARRTPPPYAGPHRRPTLTESRTQGGGPPPRGPLQRARAERLRSPPRFFGLPKKRGGLLCNRGDGEGDLAAEGETGAKAPGEVIVEEVERPVFPPMSGEARCGATRPAVCAEAADHSDGRRQNV